MNQKPAADPFDESLDAGFEADDEFAAPSRSAEAAPGGWARMDGLATTPAPSPLDAFDDYAPARAPERSVEAPMTPMSRPPRRYSRPPPPARPRRRST